MIPTDSGILHFAGFSSPCAGNFICSLEALRKQNEAHGRKTVYLFPAATGQRQWAKELAAKAPVYFLTDNLIKDILLIRSIIRKHSIGIIHIHFYKLRHLLMLDAASFPKSIRKLIHVHCEVYNHTGISGLIENLLMRSKAFIGVSQAISDQVSQRFPENKVYCVKNAICFDRLDSTEKSTAKTDAMSATAKTLLMFGHDYKVKGVDLAIRAVGKLTEKRADLQLAVVTSSVERTTRQINGDFGEVPSYVHILPSAENVAAYYRMCDLFLAPSRKEGFSYAAVEASSLEVPIVLSNVPAHKELVLPHGFYFESSDTQDLEKQIIKALDASPAMKDKLREQAEQLRNIYRIDEWTKKISNIYNEK